ncbi:DoxX family membrane protein [Mucilaginibacter sp. Bleaf8]|uniref:DoxX family membrane protein n=1 Tax=Mucilaginibacter sp. Bleaf8 TaxID=2834430 RepID=UPI001BD14A40|nr:DoxX family membrane protein [Mucilaginibacter sp. Bleaf8]MBS7564480.1 DoxX family membrane protein [Mucilaginibacter sp. Bleaf8]
MKIAVIIVRVLMGLMYLFASVVVLFKINMGPQPELHGGAKSFMEGMIATGYFLTLVKVTELVCAIAFITGFFAPLATVVIFPITLNIFLYHAFLTPGDLLMPALLLLGNLLLAYAYRKHYAKLVVAKAEL